MDLKSKELGTIIIAKWKKNGWHQESLMSTQNVAVKLPYSVNMDGGHRSRNTNRFLTMLRYMDGVMDPGSVINWV